VRGCPLRDKEIIYRRTRLNRTAGDTSTLEWVKSEPRSSSSVRAKHKDRAGWRACSRAGRTVIVAGSAGGVVLELEDDGAQWGRDGMEGAR
jgi:hypothetical protein